MEGEKDKKQTDQEKQEKQQDFEMDNSVTPNIDLEQDCKTFLKKANNDQWDSSSIQSCNTYTSGIHKFKIKVITMKQCCMIGIVKEDSAFEWVGQGENSWGLSLYNGQKYNFGKGYSYGQAGSVGDEYQILLDLTQFGKISFSKNGVNFGMAYNGVKKFGSLKLAISLYSVNDKFTVSYEKISD